VWVAAHRDGENEATLSVTPDGEIDGAGTGRANVRATPLARKPFPSFSQLRRAL